MNDRRDKILEQYESTSILFSGADDGLYQRHLVLDKVIDF
jgi:hypothetical protein